MQQLTATNFPSTPIPVGGGTYSWTVTKPYEDVFIQQAADPLVLVGNLTIQPSAAPPINSVINFHFTGGITIGAQTFTVFNKVIRFDVAKGAFIAQCRYDGSAWEVTEICDAGRTEWIDGGTRIVDASIDNDQLADMTRGTIKVGNSSNRPSDKAIGTANYVLKSDGNDPQWALISNSSIDAAAAIAVSKLAALTASQVVTTSAGGVLQTSATLSATLGGTGANNAAATGIQKWSAGTSSVSTLVNADITADTIKPEKLTQDARTLTVTFPVSWESGEQCNNRVQIGYACTVTNVYAVVTKALAGTDAGTIVPKNAAGVNMTLASALSFAASSALETAVDTTVSANNVVAAGDELYFTTAKTTAGGKALVTITLERTS